MFRRMIQQSCTVRRCIPIRLTIIQATCPGWGWHSARDSYWEQRGQIIGAIATGAMATSPLTTRTISIKTTSTISTVASKAENGSTARSIAVALLTETETRLTSTADALASSPPVELVIEPVLVAPEPRIALAEVARELVRVEAEEPRGVPVVAGPGKWIALAEEVVGTAPVATTHQTPSV